MDGAELQGGIESGMVVFIAHGTAAWFRQHQAERPKKAAPDSKTQAYGQVYATDALTILIANLIEPKVAGESKTT